MITNFDISRILVVDGSPMNILSSHVFKKMGLTLQELKNVDSPLIGIRGKPKKVKGDIKQSVTGGYPPCIKTTMASFMVVKLAQPYNAIMG